jgi:Asp/Glu/hydantoin racemase
VHPLRLLCLLTRAREVSSRAIVAAPCQSATAISSSLGNRFSVLVGRRKWSPKMRENVHLILQRSFFDCSHLVGAT